MSEAFIQDGDKVTCRNGHRIGVIAGDAIVIQRADAAGGDCPLCRLPWWRVTRDGADYHVQGRGWVNANPVQRVLTEPTDEPRWAWQRVNPSPTCPTAAAVAAKIADRADVGLAKYGTTVRDAGLSRLEWLIHAQEEAMDLAVYLQRLIEMEDE